MTRNDFQEAVTKQPLRLRVEPSLETFAPMFVPTGTQVSLLSRDTPGWVQLQDDRARAGWCTRRMLDVALNAASPSVVAAENRMWHLVQLYTGKVGYHRGAKASSLQATPPVIDCSGWVALLLTEAMQARNADSGAEIFDVSVIDVLDPWSDRLILEIEARTSVLLKGRDITVASLPTCATMGINEGYYAWQENRPRLRGINHVAQVVRRPADQVAFVSESYSTEPVGVRLTPLGDWLDARSTEIQAGRAWAVDPFALADPFNH